MFTIKSICNTYFFIITVALILRDLSCRLSHTYVEAVKKKNSQKEVVSVMNPICYLNMSGASVILIADNPR